MKKLVDVNRKRMISRMIIIAIIFAVCLMIAVGIYIYIGSQILSRAYEPDLIVTSPDEQYELVICEWFYTVGGGSEIYIRKPGQDKWYNSWKRTEIGRTSAETHLFHRGIIT